MNHLKDGVSVRSTAVFDDSYSDFHVEHRTSGGNAVKMPAKHYHNLFEIYYYLGSNMIYNVGTKNLALKKHDILLINKFVFHKSAYGLSDQNERILIIFNLDMFAPNVNKTVISKILKLFQHVEKIEFESEEQMQSTHALFTNLVSSYESASPYGQFISKLNLIELCLRLVEISKLDELYPDDECDKAPKNTVSEVIKYIATNYYTEISLDLLSDHFYINKFHLCHLFKNETGLSIIDFINRKRLFEAEKLLRNSDSNVTEICYKVGFSSINHFIKLFKHTYNLTPKKFRDSLGTHE